MAGTIVVQTNLAGLYYDLVRMECDEGPRIEFADGLPLVRGETQFPVPLNGLYQFTFRDLDGLYGGGSFGNQVVINGGTATITKNLYDADGNDLVPICTPPPPPDPSPPPPSPETETETETTPPPPSPGLIARFVAILRMIFELIFQR